MLNLVERTTPEFLQRALDHVAEAGGFEQSAFSDVNLSTKFVLLGEGPVTRDPEWTARLRNTPASLSLLVDMWTTECLQKRSGERRKRDQKEVANLAEYAAFTSRLIEVLRADQTLMPEAVAALEHRLKRQCAP